MSVPSPTRTAHLGAAEEGTTNYVRFQPVLPWHVDEDWNMSQWGRDEQALAGRDFRFKEMQAAAKVLAAPKP